MKTQTSPLGFKNLLFYAAFSLLLQVASYAQFGQLGPDLDGKAPNDQAGSSVSLSADGRRVAIGSPGNSGNGYRAGHVRIYDWNDHAWIQAGGDLEGEAQGDQAGSSVSLSADGQRVAIGSWFNVGNGTTLGQVRIYDWDGTFWVQTGGDINGAEAGDESAKAVCLSADGSRVAISARFEDGSGRPKGRINVYTWNGSDWAKVGRDIDRETVNTESGRSIALSADGNRIAIGTIDGYRMGENAGHVRVFDFNGTAWVQAGVDINGEAAGDWSGYSVSLSASGRRLAIGAPGNDASGYDAGHVRVYDWDGSVWKQAGLDIDGEAAGDVSGWPVSLSADGNRLAISGYYNDGNGNGSGHVRLYAWDGTAWVQAEADIDGEAMGDNFGYSIALSGDGRSLAIGANANNGNGRRAGHVRVYGPPATNTAINPLLEANHSFEGIFPNPASHTTTFAFSLETPGVVIAKVYNVLGQMVGQKSYQGISGSNELVWEVSQLPAGRYQVELTHQDVRLTKKLVVIQD